MKIEWNSNTYRTIRKNICKWSDKKSDIFEISYCDDFEEILEEYDAYVDHNDKYTNSSFSFGKVVDSLGMNEDFIIKFRDPNKYLLFLLRWA